MFPQQNQGQQVTGTEGVDTNVALRQYIAQEVANAQHQAQQPITIQDPLTNQNVTFQSAEQVRAYIDDLLKNASAVFEEKDRALQEARAAQTRFQQQPTPQTQAQPAAPAFNVNEYHDLLLKDPLKAPLNAQDYLDEARGTKKQLAEAYASSQQLQAAYQNMYRQQLTDQFRQRVPYVDLNDQRVVQALEAARSAMGAQPTVDAYEAAYGLALRRGWLQPPPQRQAQNVIPFQQQQQQSQEGIPFVPSGGQPLQPSEQAQLQAFAELSPEARERWMQSEGFKALFGRTG